MPITEKAAHLCEGITADSIFWSMYSPQAVEPHATNNTHTKSKLKDYHCYKELDVLTWGKQAIFTSFLLLAAQNTAI